MRVLFAVVFVLLLSLPTFAQVVPAAEVFGGYSFTHDTSINKNLMGWAGSITGNFNKWLGVTVGAEGGYGTIQVSGTDIDLSAHSIVAGPRFSARSNSKTVPFGELLLGLDHSSASVVGSGASENAFLVEGRGGVTGWISPRFGVQFGAGYGRAFVSGASGGAFGFQVGVAFGVGGGPR